MVKECHPPGVAQQRARKPSHSHHPLNMTTPLILATHAKSEFELATRHSRATLTEAAASPHGPAARLPRCVQAGHRHRPAQPGRAPAGARCGGPAPPPRCPRPRRRLVPDRRPRARPPHSKCGLQNSESAARFGSCLLWQYLCRRRRRARGCGGRVRRLPIRRAAVARRDRCGQACGQGAAYTPAQVKPCARTGYETDTLSRDLRRVSYAAYLRYLRDRRRGGFMRPSPASAAVAAVCTAAGTARQRGDRKRSWPERPGERGRGRWRGERRG